jgi:putative restriction endonuclease
MDFKQWMTHQKLSQGSIKKYYGALEGALSKWVIEANLTQHNILKITDPNHFNTLYTQILNLPIFKDRDFTGHTMYSNALKKYAEFLATFSIQTIENDIEEIITNSSISSTQKTQLINARIGQGQFRKDLLHYWEQCAVTGFQSHELLVASHIKPWSKSSNEERLDPYNGLLLIPNIDKVFDKGLISFSENGSILISQFLPEANMLGIDSKMKVNLTKKHQVYMQYHRDYLYKK